MTPRQRQALDFIKAYIAANNYSPSYDEIAERLDLASKSGVHRIVSSLVEQGYLIREGHARGIVLTDQVFTQCRSSGLTGLSRTVSELIKQYGSRAVANEFNAQVVRK